MPLARCLPLRLRVYHVGASFVSLAPTYFISQSALTPLLLLSKPQPLCWVAVWGRRFAAVLLYTGKISILTVLSTFKRLPVSGKSFLFPVPAVYADQASPAARLLGKGLGADNVPLARCLPLRLRAYHSSQATIACGDFCCFCDACGPNTRAENQGERQWRELISRPVVSSARRPAAASHLPPTHPLWSEIHPQTCR